MKYFCSKFLIILFACSLTTFAQLKVKDQDSTPHTLMQVNDEGTAGSITFENAGDITPSSYKLYRNGSKLYWNGSPLTTALSTIWTLSGNNIYYNSGNVGVGTTSPSSKLSVGGSGNSDAAIYGESSLTTGYGVYGYASSTTDDIHYGGNFKANGDYGSGVYGEASGRYGNGVYGYASSTADMAHCGGYFEAEGEYGLGVCGKAHGIDGRGVYGAANGSSGRGVFGEARGNDGSGVFGMAHGSSGYGVYGYAYGASAFAGYFDGRGYFSGHVGIGTTTPAEKLTIKMGGTTWNEPHFALEAYGSTNKWDFTVGGSDIYFIGYNESTKMVITTDGKVGIGTTNPQGKLDVNGAIYQRGGQIHADYVFEDTYELESIEEHSEFMWENKHLKAIPKAAVDENGNEYVEVGSHRKGIVEELEKAHIYIEELYKQNKMLEKRILFLESKIE